MKVRKFKDDTNAQQCVFVLICGVDLLHKLQQ